MSGDQSLFNVINEGSSIAVDKDDIYVFGGLEKSSSSDSGSSTEPSVYPVNSFYKGVIGTDTASSLAPLDPTRVFASLTRLGSKIFLIFGFHPETGWSEDVHMYDIASNTWSRVEMDEDDDEVPAPRDKHCTAAVGDEMYVFGGFGPMDEDEEEEEEEEEKLSPVQEESAPGEQQQQRQRTEVAKEKEDEDEEEEDEAKGPSASFSWFNDMWILKVNEQTGVANWRQPLFTTAARPTPRAAGTLSLDPKRQRLVNFGGRDYTGRRNDVNIFDIRARKWMLDVAEGGTAPCDRSYHAACVHSDRLVICGGRDRDNKDLHDLFLFDLESFFFEQVSLDAGLDYAPRSCHTVAVVEDKLFIIGGVCSYDPETMLCRNAVRDVKAIPWAVLISQETEPSAKKARLSVPADGQ